jgi:hypothetical protein
MVSAGADRVYMKPPLSGRSYDGVRRSLRPWNGIGKVGQWRIHVSLDRVDRECLVSIAGRSAYCSLQSLSK